MPKQTYPFDLVTVVIPSGATGLSAEIDLTGQTIARIIMPATWVAANLTFQGSETAGGTFTNIYDAYGTEYTVVAAASRRIIVPPSDLLGNCILKIRSGTSGTAVDQTASRTLQLLVRGLA